MRGRILGFLAAGLLAGCASAEDSAITDTVRRRIAAEPALTGLAILVDTTDHVVYLRGAVPTETFRDEAVRVAAAVPGVSRVENALSLQNIR